ncbi:SufE family protein [Candidatus Peregrinibacteria bacterium]|nr:SufE family protein [Candidatus Peregrinibacteria bacterium]
MIPALQNILDELSAMPDSTEKLKFLLSLADDLPEFPENEKTSKNKIHGCASNAYLVAEYRNGKMYFRGDSDAQIPKGILALFLFGCEGLAPQEILELSPEMFEKTGLKNILSPSRVNGAYAIFARMKEEAGKCKMQNC